MEDIELNRNKVTHHLNGCNVATNATTEDALLESPREGDENDQVFDHAHHYQQQKCQQQPQHYMHMERKGAGIGGGGGGDGGGGGGGLSEKRDEWNNKLEYMLSVIGYVVDLGNCVRFPYVTYKNGGGAFLIPYTIFLVLIGVPMMYLEMSIGQYFRVGNISLWGKVNVYMKGIGYSSLLVVSYITLYYSTIIAYAVFYLLASFRYVLPWSTCDNEWNSPQCADRTRNASALLLSSLANNNNKNVSSSVSTKMSSPAEEYFNRHMLAIHKSSGLDDLGPIKLDLTCCLVLVYVLMYVCIFNGVKSTGKAVYVTATLPYIILVFLLIHGLTLSGSANGIYYFLMPSFDKLNDFECWKVSKANRIIYFLLLIKTTIYVCVWHGVV